MKPKNLRGEEGQAAVLITLLLMFALIALTALAIDGGHLYVVRRDLQNMSDAACLAAATELSLGGDEAGAIEKAKEYVISNGGDFFYAWPDERPNEGSGVTLIWGIEVTGADVRVALQTFVDTYFTMIFNRSEALVGARSHCNATAAGGLLPIAVRRYDIHEPAGTLDLLANKLADPREGGPGYPADSTPTPWEGRYGPMTIYLPNDYVPQDSLDKDDPLTGAIDCDVGPPDGVYVGVCVLGQRVLTNNDKPNYEGFISLDIRNVSGTPWMFNGATGQADTNKALSEQWFHTGYWGPNPMVGDQLAMLDGGSIGLSVQDMAEHWDVGDEFVAVIYSGYIWHDPELDMRIDEPEGYLCPSFPCTTDTVTYTVTLEKPPATTWESDATFELDGYFMEEIGGCGVITPTVDMPSTVMLPQGESSVSFPMTVAATNPITTTCASALTVQAREMGVPLGLKRWASTNVLYGEDEEIGPDLTMYASALELNAYQDHSVDIYLTTRGFGGPNKYDADLTAELIWPPDRTWGDVFSSSPSGKIEIREGKDIKSTFVLAISPGASPTGPGTPYTVRLTASPGGAPSASVDIDVYVYSFTPGEVDIKDFVIVEGFAPFRVSYVDANTIGAYAIGPIAEHLEDIISGLNPRLLPW